MIVAFRTDASTAIGTGHVMRCLALADAIVAQGRATCTFIMRGLTGHLGDLVAARGHRVAMLSPDAARPAATANDGHIAWLEADPADDAAETVTALGSGADWLVVDHYALGADWEGAVRVSAKRIAAIDDLADRPHDCDLLLDQNLQRSAVRYDGLVPEGCELLLGPRFALLRPEFAARRAALIRDPAAPVRRVLVFLGGVDAPGATQPALVALERVRKGDMRGAVVVGRSNPRAEALKAWCAKRPWIEVHGGDSDLAALMCEADLTIGAGGTTAWERCALRLPSILVQIADNQREGCEALAREGAALFAGEIDAGLPDRLAAMLGTLIASPELRTSLAERGGALVDGRGTERVIGRLAVHDLTLRRATVADSDAIFTWRNAEETRHHFRDPSPIAAHDHKLWLRRVVDDQATDLLIAETRDGPVGVLRFDCTEATAEVSIYLVPGRAGRGEGSRLLRAGLDWLARERPGLTAVGAEVLVANAGSHAAFLTAGFNPVSTIYRHALPGAQ